MLLPVIVVLQRYCSFFEWDFGCIFFFFFFLFFFFLFLFLSSLEKYVSFVLVGGEPVLGGFSILTCLFVSFVCLLCCLSHLLRGSTSSLRTHLSSGWGYVVSSPLWSSRDIRTWYLVPGTRYYFFGYVFPFYSVSFFSFLFFLSFVSFSLFRCTWVAGVSMLCLSYLARWHGMVLHCPLPLQHCGVLILLYSILCSFAKHLLQVLD